MKKKLSITTLLFLMCALIMLFTNGCGARYMVKGQVIDAENGNAIEGAAIVISWIGHKFGPPYASGEHTLEVAEDLSDENGTFQIPKYVSKSFYMGVYKKGYVCWNSQDILLKKTAKGRHYKKRKGFKIENGMKIKLEVFTDEYSRNQHAHFTDNTAGICEAPYNNGIFRKAARFEILLHNKLLRGE